LGVGFISAISESRMNRSRCCSPEHISHAARRRCVRPAAHRAMARLQDLGCSATAAGVNGVGLRWRDRAGGEVAKVGSASVTRIA
jgi:hypothetical protein